MAHAESYGAQRGKIEKDFKPKTMKTIKLIAVAGLIAIMLSSCNKNEDAGPRVTVTKNLLDYNELEVYGSMSVEIVEGMSDDIRITAPDNLMKYIDTYVFSERLTIRENDNDIRESKVHIEISETALEYIYLSGSGSIIADTIHSSTIALRLMGSGILDIPVDCNGLNARLNGSGRITSGGLGENVDGWVDGSGAVNLKGIEAQSAVAKVEGSGILEVYASESIFARVIGSGLIRYWGNPSSLDTDVNGSGSVIKMN